MENNYSKETQQEKETEGQAGTEQPEVRMESMEDYAKELEASFRSVKEGDILSGTVISVDEEGAVLDLQYYAQGVIKAADMSADPHFSILEEVKVGEVLEACVVKNDDGEGNILLSRKEAAQELSWDVLKRYLEEGCVLNVKIAETVNAGVIAYLEGIRAFIPASQLSLTYVEDTSEWLGKTVKVKVITADREKDKLVLSAKSVEKEAAEEELHHKVSMMVPGTVLEGTVESLMPYGAFVNLSGGMSGLVHISQISQKRIKKPSEVLTVGDKVKVKILNTNDHKISLSIKAVEEESVADEMSAQEAAQYSSGGEATTSLASLFKNLKF